MDILLHGVTLNGEYFQKGTKRDDLPEAWQDRLSPELFEETKPAKQTKETK
jgi:hypothetical protein